MVVDGDAHVGQAIGLWLKHNGFRVSTADSGSSGLAALDNAAFDLMIVDVFMPGMRGVEAIRLFHQRAPSVPLVAISGSAFPEMDGSAPDFLRLATALGATRCLRKPFKPATLLGVIGECLAEAEPHRRQIAASGPSPKHCWTTRCPALPGGSAGACREVGPARRSGRLRDR